ncbi:hypothetical protein MRB53_014684 [Persea americana]|uniref:Uncharacterized protein n=1 Tax=Persea americana TaxID=3435 RepID=A0ACC2KBR8_PERAE|nr:hypothetical protein MRB53_014684 [Persea americana]
MEFLPLLQTIAWFSALLIIYHMLKTWANNYRNMRPGPPEPAGRWPVIGHLHLLLLSKEPILQKLGSMADRYGPIFMLRIGTRRTLVVSSWEAVKDCFTINDKALSTRPRTAAAEHMGYNYAMFGFAPYGPYWRELRKIVMLQILSNARLDSLKHVRATEINTRVKNLHRIWSMNGRSAVPIDLKQWCGDLTLDIVVRMVVGKRCFEEDSDHGDDDNSEARRVRTAISRFFYLMVVFVVSDVIPLLKWFDFQGHRRAMKATAKELDSLLVKWIKEHRRRRSLAEAEGRNEDFMDVMLSITEDGEMAGYDSDTIIKATCMALILGGTDATSVNLARAIALVVTSPHVLKKAQEELDIHVGRDRNVDESDIKNLIYLQAIAKEALRLGPDDSATVAREAMQDCKINGYHVPAGTQVMANIWKLHQDPRVWSDPCQFRPERFLTKHAGVEPRGQHFEYIPFGSGRRSCPGISFALQVIHLVLARVIHGFDLAVPTDAPFKTAQAQAQAWSLGSPKSDPIKVLFNPRLSPELYN